MTVPDPLDPHSGASTEDYLRSLSDEARSRLALASPGLGFCDLVDACPSCLRPRRPIDCHLEGERGIGFVSVCWGCRRTWESSLPAEVARPRRHPGRS
jgi:hypothetical protein